MNEFKFSEIYLGLEVSFTAIINEEKMTAFLNITGDVSPLHVDAAFARQKGFKDKVTYGMLSASFYSTLVGVYLPGRYAVLHGLDIKFMKPVYAGDKLTISGKVAYINESYKQIEVKSLIINQDNVKVSKALIKIGITQ
jgi:3-hydroxybutyryl-CoA dehydratase